MDNEPTQQAVNAVTKETKTTRLNVTDIEWLQDEAGDGESPAATLSRLRDELLTSREQEIVLEAAIKEYGTMISQLNSDLETLRSGHHTTALTPAGQSSFSDFGGGAIKDVMDEIKDVCDDEIVCAKTALHMIDTKADIVSRQLDRDHSREEKAKDRDHVSEEKAKDRQLKQDIETSRIDHQKDLALIKKGIVKESDLEAVVFLGSMEKRKTAGERLAEKKNRAYHAANTEEDDFGDPGDGEELGDAGHPEHEDLDHV